MLFLQMFAAGLAGGLLVTFIDNRLGKPIDPEREERAKEWDSLADRLIAEAIRSQSRGYKFDAGDKSRAARRARKHARAIRRGNV